MTLPRLALWLVGAIVVSGCSAPNRPDADRDAGTPSGIDLGLAEDAGPEDLPDGWTELGEPLESLYDVVQLPDGTVVAAAWVVPPRVIVGTRLNTRIVELDADGTWRELESPFDDGTLEYGADSLDVLAGRLIAAGVTRNQGLVAYERDGEEWRPLLQQARLEGAVIRVRTDVRDTLLVQVGRWSQSTGGLADTFFEQDLVVRTGEQVERIAGPETSCSEFAPPDVVAVLDGEGRPVVSHQVRGCEAETAWIRRWEDGEWVTLWSSETDTLGIDLGYDAVRDTLLATRVGDLETTPAEVCAFGPEPSACASVGLGQSGCANDAPFRSSSPLRALFGGGAVGGFAAICCETVAPGRRTCDQHESILWLDGEAVPTPRQEALRVVIPVAGGVLAASWDASTASRFPERRPPRRGSRPASRGEPAQG